MNEFERGSLIEGLGLRRDALEAAAHRTHQWGQAIANLLPQHDSVEAVAEHPQLPPPRVLRSEAASLFTIAGSYRMLLSPDLAQQSMRPAAAHFAANGSTFAYPLAICAGRPRMAQRTLPNLQPELTAEDRANTLLALGWMEVTGSRQSQDRTPSARRLLREHLDQARPVAQAVVGRMRIPLEAIVRVVDAADRAAHEEGTVADLSGSLHDALIRMHDVTAAAMADRYHWQRLMSSVLPVEPEAAVLGGVAMAAAIRTDSEQEVLERIDVPPLALAPLRVGGEIARQAI